jgi:hypothetical protein
MAKIPKTKLGNKPQLVEKTRFSASTPNILSKYMKCQCNSGKIHSHSSQLIEETETAIIVKNEAETGTLNFLYKTTI